MLGAGIYMPLGNNEEGARYSGIDTDRMKIVAYVLCSFFAGIAGILFAFELGISPAGPDGRVLRTYLQSQAAVLGGCSLRGGEGSISGGNHCSPRGHTDNLQLDQYGRNFNSLGIWNPWLGDLAGCDWG